MTVPPGVVFLDHTADVGLMVEAPSPEALFHRAALGMLALLRGEDDLEGGGRRGSVSAGSGSAESTSGIGAGESPPDSLATVPVSLDAATPAGVLADWLRELLFLHGTEGRDYVEATWERLDDTGLRARVVTEASAGAVREIKGVTYHGLAIEETEDGWRAQVIFDV